MCGAGDDIIHDDIHDDDDGGASDLYGDHAEEDDGARQHDRGYDSAGLCIDNPERTATVVRATGNVSDAPTPLIIDAVFTGMFRASVTAARENAEHDERAILTPMRVRRRHYLSSNMVRGAGNKQKSPPVAVTRARLRERQLTLQAGIPGAIHSWFVFGGNHTPAFGARASGQHAFYRFAFLALKDQGLLGGSATAPEPDFYLWLRAELTHSRPAPVSLAFNPNDHRWVISRVAGKSSGKNNGPNSAVLGPNTVLSYGTAALVGDQVTLVPGTADALGAVVGNHWGCMAGAVVGLVIAVIAGYLKPQHFSVQNSSIPVFSNSITGFVTPVVIIISGISITIVSESSRAENDRCEK